MKLKSTKFKLRQLHAINVRKEVIAAAGPCVGIVNIQYSIPLSFVWVINGYCQQ